jgi:hypothetical protein
MKTPSGRQVLAFLALVLAGCSDSSEPVKPSAPETPPSIQSLDFGITPEVGGRSVVDFTLLGGELATRFQVEVGSTPGATDVATLSFPAQKGQATHPGEWKPAPIGTLFARARAENSAGSSPWSREVQIASVDPRDVIEALFLGEGRLEADGPGCFQRGEMRGWQAGSVISVVVSSSVPENQLAAVRQTVAQLPSATLGALQGTVRRADRVDPTPGVNEIAITVVPPAQAEARCRGYSACSLGRYSGPFITGATIVVAEGALPTNDWLLPHELGHAAFGLCHIHAPEGLRPGPTMTGSGSFARLTAQLEPLTLKALEAVYRAGLTAGASRAQFVAAGLVNPERYRPSAASALQPHRGEMKVVDFGGGVVEVIKPLCTRADPKP